MTEMTKSALSGKHVVLGVTGGIAAYKAVEIASRLRKAGAEVRVIMTRASQNFVTALTFREISGHAVIPSMWTPVTEAKVEHIALADWADLILVAPATANLIAKTAIGIADDMLTTTLLAVRVPVMIAPAMNTDMYENPVTQANIETLRQRGVIVIEPASGWLACNRMGKGRLPEPSSIVAEAEKLFSCQQSLAGRKILVTAGGTEEPLDPVRFLGNRSSGRMGYAIAAAAARRGADVTLVAGPVTLPDPVDVNVIHVRTAVEMHDAVLSRYDMSDAVIKAAAVADYRPEAVATDKIKKQDGDLVLRLVRNPDILLELGQKKTHQVLVGFAAETRDVEAYARTKLVKKNLDFIVANDVSRSDAGFGVSTNQAVLFFADGRREAYPLQEKSALAEVIVGHVSNLLKQGGDKHQF